MWISYLSIWIFGSFELALNNGILRIAIIKYQTFPELTCSGDILKIDVLAPAYHLVESRNFFFMLKGHTKEQISKDKANTKFIRGCITGSRLEVLKLKAFKKLLFFYYFFIFVVLFLLSFCFVLRWWQELKLG